MCLSCTVTINLTALRSDERYVQPWIIGISTKSSLKIGHYFTGFTRAENAEKFLSDVRCCFNLNPSSTKVIYWCSKERDMARKEAQTEASLLQSLLLLQDASSGDNECRFRMGFRDVLTQRVRSLDESFMFRVPSV